MKIDESVDLEELGAADPVCPVVEKETQCGKTGEFHIQVKCSVDGFKFSVCLCRGHYGACLMGRMACCTGDHFLDPMSVVLL